MGSYPAVHKELAGFLSRQWDVDVLSIQWLTVGFPDNRHYLADSPRGRFFVTVDDLRDRRLASNTEAAFEILERAFQTAYELHHDCELEFVLAAVLDRMGNPTARLDSDTTVTVFPYVTGSSNPDGTHESAEQRRSVLGYLGRLHATAVLGQIATDTLGIPLRPVLAQALNDLDQRWDAGPYAELARKRLSQAA